MRQICGPGSRCDQGTRTGSSVGYESIKSEQKGSALDGVEPFSYDFAGIGDKKECVRRIFLNKIPEFDGLDPIKRCKDDILILAGECALGKNNGGASVDVYKRQRLNSH